MKRNKTLSWKSLSAALRKARSSRKKIVFTNGCFDVLHVGHIKVLDFCRKHGQILVVGLNNDSSTRRLKGSKRPIVPQKERAQMLAALESVTYVVLFGQDTPEKLIKMVKPDVLIKGGDYKTNQIVGREFAKKVVRVPLVKGRSSTGIIDRILKKYRKK